MDRVLEDTLRPILDGYAKHQKKTSQAKKGEIGSSHPSRRVGFRRYG